MRITLDTAILVRTNARAEGPAKELLDLIQHRGDVLVLSAFLLAELERVLRYPRVQAIYHLDERDIREHVEYLESLAEIVAPAEGPPIVLNDPNDDPVVYTAVAGLVDILCTLDADFYEPNVLAFCSRQRIRILPDVELLRLLREGSLR